jgi:hypothetical protein
VQHLNLVGLELQVALSCWRSQQGFDALGEDDQAVTQRRFDLASRSLG